MKLVLHGVPISQARMKFSGRNGIGRIYDPREKQKREIKKIIGDQYLDNPRFIHPRVSFIFHMPIPKSLPKKLLPIYNSGILKHEKKPDTDNLVKLYLDCMDPIMFDGDQKVMLGPCVKVYNAEPKTIVLVHETTEQLTRLEVDPMIWNILTGAECERCSSSGMGYPHDCDIPHCLVS